MKIAACLAGLWSCLIPGIASAHGLWVLIDQGGEAAHPVVVWYADRPEPGRSSMLDRVQHVTVLAVSSDGHRTPVSLERATSGEMGALLGDLPAGKIVQLEALCDVGVRQPRPAVSAGSEGSRGMGGEGRGSGGGRGMGEGRGSGGGGRRGGGNDPQVPYRQQYFSKFLQLEGSGASLPAHNDEMTLDLLVRRDGNGLIVTALHEGVPMTGTTISISNPQGERQRLTAGEDGTARIDTLTAGPYQIRARAEIDAPGELNGEKFEKTLRDGSLILLVDASAVPVVVEAK